MDLMAYAQIGKLEGLVAKNGIVVPRLRGYRLMKDEKPLTEEEIRGCTSFDYEAYRTIEEHFILEAIKQGIKSDLADYSRSKNKVFWYRYINLGTRTGKCKDKYFDYYGDKQFHWNRFHGKLRKKLKFIYKKAIRRAEQQYALWNKYAGKENILYIHARIGGGNWNYFGGPELTKQPWFLEKVDDCFDSTYCDIYARINCGKDEAD